MTKFMYFRDGKGFPVGCVAYEVKDVTVLYGVSSYNPVDNFNKDTARAVASGRLAKATSFVDIAKNARYRDVEKAIANNILSRTQEFPNTITKAARKFIALNHA